MHYCARSADHVAFANELRAVVSTDSLHFHFDNGDPAKGLDIKALLQSPKPGTHLYFCEPEGFMKACASASAHWSNETVHEAHPDILAMCHAHTVYGTASGHKPIMWYHPKIHAIAESMLAQGTSGGCTSSRSMITLPAANPPCLLKLSSTYKDRIMTFAKLPARTDYVNEVYKSMAEKAYGMNINIG